MNSELFLNQVNTQIERLTQQLEDIRTYQDDEDITEDELEELKKETKEQLDSFLELEARLATYKIELTEEEKEKRDRMKTLAGGILSVADATKIFDTKKPDEDEKIGSFHQDEIAGLSVETEEHLISQAKNQVLEAQKNS
ncbi:unnamed protein product [Moneuplotes crassus]|uniref:Uncharacterized protein n=1 Tax=Euplotes crassus TaxID=5936 RepID=A0AAD1XEJ6_EUPCR|nr:unnamed protein product [Moneuplotes crassus]